MKKLTLLMICLLLLVSCSHEWGEDVSVFSQTGVSSQEKVNFREIDLSPVEKKGCSFLFAKGNYIFYTVVKDNVDEKGMPIMGVPQDSKMEVRAYDFLTGKDNSCGYLERIDIYSNDCAMPSQDNLVYSCFVQTPVDGDYNKPMNAQIVCFDADSANMSVIKEFKTDSQLQRVAPAGNGKLLIGNTGTASLNNADGKIKTDVRIYDVQKNSFTTVCEKRADATTMTGGIITAYTYARDKVYVVLADYKGEKRPDYLLESFTEEGERISSIKLDGFDEFFQEGKDMSNLEGLDDASYQTVNEIHVFGDYLLLNGFSTGGLILQMNEDDFQQIYLGDKANVWTKGLPDDAQKRIYMSMGQKIYKLETDAHAFTEVKPNPTESYQYISVISNSTGALVSYSQDNKTWKNYYYEKPEDFFS
ncbi:hypothetical protein [Acetanaerobacterium elongatum]|uniref:Lipoprotein n=1 Tax=Acetanaerobacterium elongatum TaxID=258515 RepID=A0A1H0GEX7_9FIRM|nr:hypothetical protein [Acetanaerobacterium elongatum]SDO05450.1 hypothetical protein SAMN05192585_15010 [Acetanaerobacterium elongatum]